MCSLVMSLFSRDYIKTEIKYQQCFNLLARVQYLHSAWFLDGRTSILVSLNLNHFNMVCMSHISYIITKHKYILLALVPSYILHSP